MISTREASTWKVKPVSPRNLLKTLQPGGAALLFPGGAREVFKRQRLSQKFWLMSGVAFFFIIFNFQ